jgi:hypothetical protein
MGRRHAFVPAAARTVTGPHRPNGKDGNTREPHGTARELRRYRHLGGPPRWGRAPRRNGPLTTLADRLWSRGEKAEVVLVAVARKVLTFADAVVRTSRLCRLR